MLLGNLRRVLFERPPPLGARTVDPAAQRYFAQPGRSGLLVDHGLDRLAPLPLHIADSRLHFAQLVGFARRLKMRPRAGFVEHVDRLVGKEPVGNVTLGKRHARLQGRIAVTHLVVPLIMGRYVAQDAERLFGSGRLDDDLLEAPFERRIALDILAIFVERGGSDGLQLAARKSRLEDIGRIETALRRTGTDDGVYFIDEDDRIFSLAQLVQELLHALLELAAELRAGDQRRDVE